MIRIKELSKVIKENLLYISVWIVTLISIILINKTTSQVHNFLGETNSKEVNINTRYAVTIKSMNVIPGQFVRKGQLLVELERKDLTKSINDLSYKLNELRAQYNLNSELNENIRSLKKFRSKEEENKSEDILSVQIQNAEKELEGLLKEQESLYIFATFDGNIGFVNFKVGESVSPFTPLMTMHKETPSFVRGYIHEKLMNEVSINKKVQITTHNGTKKIMARVVSVGNRVIEFPERFRRIPEVKVWGREVMIELPAKNNFLLGEKVFIKINAKKKFHFLSRTIADDDIPMSKYNYNLTQMRKEDLKENIIEPSGIRFIEDINKFIMISDDNLEHQPLLYLLNPDGRIDSHVIKVDGIQKIKDMEAISVDDTGNIVICSSQSTAKNGKISKLRRKLIRLQRKGINFSVSNEVDLFTQLNNLAKIYKNQDWVQYLKTHKKSKYAINIDVEGIFIKDDTLYLGLRNHLSKRKVMILKINKLNSFFATNTIDVKDVSIASMLSLPINRSQDRFEGISDLHLEGDELYIVTASNIDTNSGRVLKTNISKVFDSKIYEIQFFSDHRPEGISYNSLQDEFVVVFDSNNKDAQLYMSRIKEK